MSFRDDFEGIADPSAGLAYTDLLAGGDLDEVTADGEVTPQAIAAGMPPAGAFACGPGPRGARPRTRTTARSVNRIPRPPGTRKAMLETACVLLDSLITQRDAGIGCGRSGQRRPATSRRTEPQPAPAVTFPGPGHLTGPVRWMIQGRLPASRPSGSSCPGPGPDRSVPAGVPPPASRTLTRDQLHRPGGHGPVRHARRTQYRRHDDQRRPCPQMRTVPLRRSDGIARPRA